MLEFANRVGRLLEVRIGYPFSLAEIAAQRLEFRKLVDSGKRWISVSDFRQLGILAPEVADYIVSVLRRDNPHIERSGYLVAHSTANLQWTRLVREAGGPSRRVFQDEAELFDWLSELLNAEERQQLTSFLARRQGSARPG